MLTPNGAVDYVEKLTKEVAKRYFVKGRPGTGKSTFLKKLVKNAENRGIDCEVYHCGFVPDSVDMLIFREIGICIFDSTSPHEYFPTRDDDEIIDMYQLTVKAKTDEKNYLKLEDIIRRYKIKINEAISYLIQAKEYHDQIESIYLKTTKYEHLIRLSNEICKIIDAERE
jgi:nucleoside-triphosphatase THEP1